MKKTTIHFILIVTSLVFFLGADCEETVSPEVKRTYPAYEATDLLKGPYVQNASMTAAQVVFESNAGGLCKWGDSPELGKEIDAERDEVTGQSICYLEELTPGSLTYYRVTMDGEDMEGSFVTEPDENIDFNFLVMGDTRTNHAAHQQVVDSILEFYPYDIPDMLFNTGDLVDHSSDEEEWNAFFEIESELLTSTVFYPVMGNHDAGVDHNDDIFNPWTTTGEYYTFRYGNTLFVVMDTEGWFEKGSDQYKMVVNALEEAYEDPEIEFKFVFFHRPGVTTSKHDPDPVIVSTYLDLFEQYNVDVVFSGHNHNYEHSFLNGVHYVVTGAAGAPVYAVRGGQTWSVHAEAERHFCSVEVGHEYYKVRATRMDGSTMDLFTGVVSAGGFPGPTPAFLVSDPEIKCGFQTKGDNHTGLFEMALLVSIMLLVRKLRNSKS